MKNTIISATAIILTLVLAGCMRGQDASHDYNPNQVKAVSGANGAVEYHLILPIVGKPYASGAQFIFDQAVSAQAGGDIASITVDPATVEVTFSEQIYGEGLFIMVGRADVALVSGKKFLAWFREPITGGCQQDRIFSTYSPYLMLEITAYREGLARWTTAADWADTHDQTEAIQAQLSIEMLIHEITADGTVRMDALEDWKKANQIAWTKRGVLGLH
jgi:hypothetical protein